MRLPKFEVMYIDVREGIDTLKDSSIDLVVTSPPYYAQRNYFVEGQIGREPTSAQYVDVMVDVFYNHLYRKLKPHGLIFLNLGDSYNGSGGQGNQAGVVKERGGYPDPKRNYNDSVAESVVGRLGGMSKSDSAYKPRDLMSVPWRVYEALRQSGYYLRSVVVWNKCLSGGTWLYAKCQRGERLMMVRELTRVPLGSVSLWNGEKWTRVIGISKNQRHSTELELVLRSGERISCTPNHKWPTADGRLVEAGELKCGDKLTSITLPEPETPRDSIHIGLDAAWLAGLYLAEGSKSEDTIQIASHVKEAGRYQRLREIAASYGGTAAVHKVSTNGVTVNLNGKMLNAIINQFVFGHTAKDKCLSETCWEYSNDFLWSLLAGYLEGDGHWEEDNKRWRIGFTRNYNLERDLRTLAARLGFQLTLKLSVASFNGKKYPAFKGEIRFETNPHYNHKDRNEIVEIRKARCREVYDITVEDEPHIFATASGLLTKNSNPMPESVTGVRWMRCRIKVRPNEEEVGLQLEQEDRGTGRTTAALRREGRGPLDIWQDCPGCPKCLPNDGYVLRWGSGRPTSSYELIGILTKERYYWDQEAVRTEYADSSVERRNYELGGFGPQNNTGARMSKIVDGTTVGDKFTGANLRNVWELSTASFHEAHFATFPESLPEICIKAGSSEKGCCSVCGSPYARVLEYVGQNQLGVYSRTADVNGFSPSSSMRGNGVAVYRTVGWKATCSHKDAEAVPAVVCDPFSGAGTTGIVANRLGRDYKGFELNREYAQMSMDRLREDAPLLEYAMRQQEMNLE